MRFSIQITLILLLIITVGCTNKPSATTPVLVLDRNEVVQRADQYLTQKPITIAAFVAERSAGGLHDYYSEGSYWWENPEDPEGPYIRRDGHRNPNNFRSHKTALRDFALQVTTLTAAYQITSDEKYAYHAIKHLNAWFSNADTRMNPSLLYAQAIKGINTGRGIGIIDTLRLIDVALSVEALAKAGLLKNVDLAGTKKWFNDYAEWLTTHPYGDDEKKNNNNHSTWWGAQVAAYAQVAERADLLQIAQQQFKDQLEIQLAADGSFPDELGRTKPWHYMEYNLRGWTTFALLASTPTKNLWQYESKNGTLKKAIEFATPFISQPEKWTYLSVLEPKIHPERNDYLVFAYYGLNDNKYLELWQALDQNTDDNSEKDANLVLWRDRMNG
ncbi:MAG: alginate lyase family protein [Saprospiraceae bacterium]